MEARERWTNLYELPLRDIPDVNGPIKTAAYQPLPPVYLAAADRQDVLQQTESRKVLQPPHQLGRGRYPCCRRGNKTTPCFDIP